jgi:hypothetical protein
MTADVKLADLEKMNKAASLIMAELLSSPNKLKRKQSKELKLPCFRLPQFPRVFYGPKIILKVQERLFLRSSRML